jgi:superfamily II DNA or RNA helicase
LASTDLIDQNMVGELGLMVGEALDNLVEAHSRSLDKRAAQIQVSPPSLAQESGILGFTFQLPNQRGGEPTKVEIDVQPNQPDFGTPQELDLVALQACSCEGFEEQYACEHTLACAWWMQEQLNRRGAARVMEFFSELQVDSVAAGRDMVDELLTITAESKATDAKIIKADPAEVLQWRVKISHSRYYCPIQIQAYLQRPKKNGRGWTKGREIRDYDLLQRDYTQNPIDGRIATIAASPTYSFDNSFYNEFRAIEMLVGHPNVAISDEQSTPIEIVRGELAITLEPVEVEDDGPEQETSSVRYRPSIRVAGLNVDFRKCEMILGRASPAEPMVVIAESTRPRWVVCALRDPRATQMIDFLMRSDWDGVLLDAKSAAKFAVHSAKVDSLIRVELPPQLAGPIQPIEGELIMNLRPRAGAGLHIELAVHDERFRELVVPASGSDIIVCLTPEGPLRLQRSLTAEKQRADEIVDRFGLAGHSPDGPYAFCAVTDREALELLARLHEAGDAAPRMIWPEGETIKVRGELLPSSLKVQIDDRRDWFGLEGSITVDGREIPLAELLAAVRDQRSLVRVGDREFAKISDAFRARLLQLGDTVVIERGEMKVADAVVPAVVELMGNDVPIEATTRWHESIERLESLADWNPEKPESLDAQLREYQLDGYRWLSRLSRWGVGAVLADDMGLGKTVQTLGVLLERSAGGPALVIAPTSVGENWMRETNRFASPLNPRLYREENRKKLIEGAGPSDLIIVSYQMIQRDAELFASRSWHTLVLDEAQFIKNAQTKTSQAIRKLDADWRIGLSGTPLENHLGELWSLFRTLSPGLLGSWDRFRSRFAEPIERFKDDDRRQALSRLVRPFILRRTKDTVLKELPPRTEITLQAILSTEEKKLYENTRIAALAELSQATDDARGTAGQQGAAGQQRIKTLAWLTKLRQLACHPRLVDATWTKGSAKLELLTNLVDELRDGNHRALVFSQFVKHLDLIRRSLDDRGVTYQYLDGATPAAERQKRVDAFQNGEGDLFLISLKAGGTGLNLTAADYVIHLDPWWNPAVEDQATDRAHRIGQQKPVTVYRLVASDTIEEKILQLHADKRELVSGILDGTDKAAKLNTTDLIDLIREGSSL